MERKGLFFLMGIGLAWESGRYTGTGISDIYYGLGDTDYGNTTGREWEGMEGGGWNRERHRNWRVRFLDCQGFLLVREKAIREAVGKGNMAGCAFTILSSSIITILFCPLIFHHHRFASSILYTTSSLILVAFPPSHTPPLSPLGSGLGRGMDDTSRALPLQTKTMFF